MAKRPAYPRGGLRIDDIVARAHACADALRVLAALDQGDAVCTETLPNLAEVLCLLIEDIREEVGTILTVPPALREAANG